MARLAIEAAPDAGTLSGGELVPILKNGAPARTTANAFATYTAGIIGPIIPVLPETGAVWEGTASPDDSDVSHIPNNIGGLVYVTGVTINSNDWIRFPDSPQGKQIRGWSLVAHQIRTAADSGDRINNVVADDITDAAIPAQTYWEADAVEDQLWILRAWNIQGTARPAIIPSGPVIILPGSDFEFLLESGDKLLLEDSSVLLLETAP